MWGPAFVVEVDYNMSGPADGWADVGSISGAPLSNLVAVAGREVPLSCVAGGLPRGTQRKT
jgi:hypothetical protein